MQIALKIYLHYDSIILIKKILFYFYLKILHNNILYMKHFINLTSRVINKLYIIEIIKKPNRYSIHMSDHNVESFFIIGSGGSSTISNIIEVCEIKAKQDYDIITELIKSGI